MDMRKMSTERLEAIQTELQSEKEKAAKKFDQQRVVRILFCQAEIEAILNSRARQIQTEREIQKFLRQLGHQPIELEDAQLRATSFDEKI